MPSGPLLSRLGSPRYTVPLAAFAILVVGITDFLTGTELNLEIFYVLPVYLVASAAGRGPGLALAAAASLTWLVADWAAGHRYAFAPAPYWNVLGGFLVLALLATAVAASQARLREREAARRELARKTRELARSNADLEEFAAVAAHDLKSPLALVGGYVQLLRHRFGGQLAPEAIQYLDQAAQGVLRMEQLIEDLLAYARVATGQRQPESVDVGAALDEALANLASELRDSGAVVTRDPLPVLPGHRRELVQLFQNLVGNAVKYRGDAPPRVQVGARQTAEGWEAFVCDNGIGVDPEQAEKIFELFERGGAPSRYPGTGVGLAICKKIVESQSGRLWVESAPGQGSTFRFTVPAAPEP